MEWSYRYRKITGLDLKMTEEELVFLLKSVQTIGKAILDASDGPVRLFDFSDQLSRRMEVRSLLDLGNLSDSVKTLLRVLNDPHLHVLAPCDLSGAGYVFDVLDPEMRPIMLFD
jgi:hypothetical protein